MEHLGFIQDMMDVKVLVLFVTARLKNSASIQEIYELCFQDEKLSYFDVCTVIPELVATGHLRLVGEDRYAITEKGRHDGEITEDSLAYLVKKRAEEAVSQFNQEQQRNRFVKTQLIHGKNGDLSVRMELNDEKSHLMRLEVLAPDQPQAVQISKNFRENAELLYNMVMEKLLQHEKFGE